MAAGAKPTILLVEDEPGIRQYVAAQLRGLGYGVIEAEDALAGRKVLEGTGTIDLLFTDVVLPNGVSGLKLARQAQALRPNIKVLLASGFSATAFAAEGGTDLPLLKKPFKRQELAEAVRRVLAAHSQGSADPSETNRMQGRGRILVVDDLDENRHFVMTLLTKAGYAVRGAVNGLEAVAAVEDGAFDLVFMDAQMPELDGIEATRRIRELAPPAGEVLIIGLSAGNLPEQIRAMEAAGMDDYVTKPFRRAELLEKIAAWGIGAGVPSMELPELDHHGPLPSEAVVGSDATLSGFNDLAALLGKDAALAAVGRLMRQIDDIFGGTRSDPTALARQAHALVAQAGLLGFRDLADRASVLEKACLGHGDVEQAYRIAEAAADAVLRATHSLHGD